MKTKIVSFHTTDSKPVKQEVKGTVILPPLVFPGYKTRVQLPAKMFPHLKLLHWLLWATLLVLTRSKETAF